MKNKLLVMFLGLFLVLTLAGCGKKEEKIEDKKTDVKEIISQKINLNDNVYYYTDLLLDDKTCGGFSFLTNVEDVVDEKWISTYEEMKSVDKIELTMHDNLEYDTQKEEKVKKSWDALVAPEKGISSLTMGFEDHQFYVGYWFINLVKDEEGHEFEEGDKYYNLAKNLEKEITDFKNNAYDIMRSNGAYHLDGTCGGPLYPYVLLDEKVCEKYNLDCERR